MDERNIIDAGGQVREKRRDIFPALAILLHLPLGPDYAPLIFLSAPAGRFDGDGLAVEFIQPGLVIEGVHMRRAAVHEQENDAPGLGDKLGKARRLRIEHGGGLVRAIGAFSEEPITVEKAGQSQTGETSPGLPEKFPPGSATKGVCGFL